jgi:cytochrome c556
MMKTVVLPAILAMGLGICLWAQSDEDYKGWMKDIGATNGKIRKGVAAKQMDGVATDATHLAEIYANLSKFWEARKADDAVTIAKSGETAANAIADAAKAGDEAKVQASMMTVGGTCNGCHMAHRAGSPGNFTIK